MTRSLCGPSLRLDATDEHPLAGIDGSRWGVCVHTNHLLGGQPVDDGKSAWLASAGRIANCESRLAHLQGLTDATASSYDAAEFLSDSSSPLCLTGGATATVARSC